MNSPSASEPNPFDELMNRAQVLSQAEIRDEIVGRIYQTTRAICHGAVTYKNKEKLRSEKLDKILTSPIWGFPIMLLMVSFIIYFSIALSGYPEELLMTIFTTGEEWLTIAFQAVNAPEWLYGLLVLGLYRGTSWVVSVMLPPMAVFFPLFALLENYGYLPRVAFNLDRLFKRAGGHGKQSLTMALGFGCNAAAVVQSRIIESPRERMIAILTNNFIPCNGRWPFLIVFASLFMAAGFAGSMHTLVTTGIVVGMVVFAIIITFATSWVLSKTMLRGVPTQYTLELPPYRRPKILKTIVRASIDKSFFVLKRAVIVAAPAGLLTWILANIMVGDTSVLHHIIHFLDPFGRALGLDGYILMAFILGLPANEIVLPILVMAYLSSGAMIEVDEMSLDALRNMFVDNGWTWLTALNTMVFAILHYPCGTTLFSIYKETNSPKWTLISALIPTGLGIAVTFLIAQVVRAMGWV